MNDQAQPPVSISLEMSEQVACDMLESFENEKLKEEKLLAESQARLEVIIQAIAKLREQLESHFIEDQRSENQNQTPL